ncbi:MAG: hypothetical protein ABI843_16115 [Dokdonella sp.]
MIRVAVYGSLVLLIAIGAWLFWSTTHPDLQLARARTEQAERMQVDPPPQQLTQADEDHANAQQFAAVRSLQNQLSGIVAAYCKEHGVMPAQLSDLAVPQVLGTFGIDRADLRNGVIGHHLLASELHAEGTILYTPVFEGACANTWRCGSADYPRIAKWLPDCTYTGSHAVPSG